MNRGATVHTRHRGRMFRLALGMLLCAPGAALWAQTPVPEVWAKDMREAVQRTPVTVADLFGREETRQLPITVFRPVGDGPHPLVVFNHGRAVADKRATQGRARYEHAVRYLVAKGFVVMVPTRIGYWETFGDFDPEQSGPCRQRNFAPMHRAVSDQVLAAVAHARTLPYVDASRWIVAGQSVGGLASVATVGRHPPGLLAGISFSGGSGGNPDASPGRPCNPEALGQHWATVAQGAQVPMLWLYWQGDQYWGDVVPRQWHQAWVGGGGRAEFHHFAPIKGDGHGGLDRDMDRWLPVVDAFLAKLGFTQPAIQSRPPATDWAEVDDDTRVPLGARARADGYRKFLAADAPRAFAIGAQGAWSYATGDYVTGRALGFCQRGGQTCQLYAVDDDVVWPGR
jgi:dienelactone hydrolase